MGLIGKIKGIFKKEAGVITQEKMEKLIEKVEVDREETLDPWQDFKSLCKEIGVSYDEVISKSAWRYLEETGGVIDDPLLQAKEVVGLLKDFEATTKEISEPKSVKKLKSYNEALEAVANFKEKLREIKSGKLTAKDIIPILTRLMQQGE